jgi:hypothetical protein
MDAPRSGRPATVTVDAGFSYADVAPIVLPVSLPFLGGTVFTLDDFQAANAEAPTRHGGFRNMRSSCS